MDNSNENVGDTNSNENWFSDKLKELQKKIFKTLHYALKINNISVVLVCIIAIVELMQLLSFSFDLIFSDAWVISGYEEIFTVLSDFFNIFKVVNYISDKSFILYLTIFYFVIVLVLMLMASFIYLSMNLKNTYENNYLSLEIFRLFGMLFNPGLIIPFYDILFIAFDCNKLNELNQTCFQGVLIMHVIFAGIGVLIILFFSFIFAFFYFEAKTLPENNCKMWTPSYKITQLFNKLAVVIFFRFCKYVTLILTY